MAVLVLGLPSAANACLVGPRVWLSGFALSDQEPNFYWGPENGSAPFSVTASEFCDDPDLTGGVTWATATEAGDTAVANTDYVAENGTFLFTGASKHDIQNDGDLIGLKDDTATESALEDFTIKLTGGVQKGVVYPPSQAPIYIVDLDGSTRVSTVPTTGPIEVSESGGTFKVPIFRAGNATGTTSVTITPSGGTPGSDYSAPSTVTFMANERFKIATITIIDDGESESDETVTITLGGVTVDGPGSMAFTIVDNDGGSTDNTPPETWFHHPRHGAVYKKGSFFADTIHVFVKEETGRLNVSRVVLALRKKLTSGPCRWWKLGGWQVGPCIQPKWILLTSHYANSGTVELYPYTKYDSLRPSMGTNIRNYTVYAKATDLSGNVSPLVVGDNKNTFEVKKA